ncbi:hypothetical protein BAUCODRAFT_20636 [Baudoinia panamericana UAMH 10762]|uniref:Zn(2)-C6 fungal-type domain-containing protein n=1 Tax=Baudoinia panamericana (strain UAMH 10762) TaxID=717646 RepID=M2NM40_BAUPA|nr:uncharacterized protein BAUCODRAFT_20636 [Baudoinia panamericana UAMH 10762]EMD00560.1 hypothetical protein BAUCODRAFT_20636 [Baudoinia panamericana UAMH 10762]
MVYRGKPSAGCENCRRAKKRCTLEQPSCARCMKLRKECSGYRDTNQLQVRDESDAVIRKAQRVKARQAPPASSTLLELPSATSVGIFTPASTNSGSSSSSDGSIDTKHTARRPTEDSTLPQRELSGLGGSLALVSIGSGIPFVLKPTPDELASTHFFNQFAPWGHWDFLRTYARQPQMDLCLALATRACGMAALNNLEKVPQGREYARSMYVEALVMVNDALRDPERRKTDASLIAVALLGYYETLVCDSRESIQSWKAHIAGATQLLRLRGKAQFRTATGRMLFRETRAQILIHCIWDDIEPPAFLWDWAPALEAESVEMNITHPADVLTKICFDFACIRAKIERKQVTDEEALAACNDIDLRMIQWSADAVTSYDDRYHYTDVEVPDHPNIWNGFVHSYGGHPGPGVWNTLRSMRILLTRSQEALCARFPFSASERAEQKAYFRRVRRQMTDDICAAVPYMLGHSGSEAHNRPSVLISAYGAIWPLFFAGTCTLERLGGKSWDRSAQQLTTIGASLSQGVGVSSAAAAQAAWILGRLDYISDVVGLKWAVGIAATLRERDAGPAGMD